MYSTLERVRYASPELALGDDFEAGFRPACAFASACIAAGFGQSELAAMNGLVENTRLYHRDDYVFRTGDPFRAIFAVRSGAVKATMFDHEGREQVLAFYLPGDVIGLHAIYPGHFPCDAVALEPTELCRFSFLAMSALAARMPIVQQHLFGLLSKELGATGLRAGEHRAEERVAAFLCDLDDRRRAHGTFGSSVQLSMSRADIANYLRLATETVSRVFTQFRHRGLISLERRKVIVLDAEGLRGIGQSLMPGLSYVRPMAKNVRGYH